MSETQFEPRQATRNGEPVTVIREVEMEGVRYFELEGEDAPVHGDELVFEPTIADPMREEKALHGERPDRSPKSTAPNIKFVGTRSRNGKEERMTEAPPQLIGSEVYDDLPSSEEQLDGFYYERASKLRRDFPKLYKPIIDKGE